MPKPGWGRGAWGAGAFVAWMVGTVLHLQQQALVPVGMGVVAILFSAALVVWGRGQRWLPVHLLALAVLSWALANLHASAMRQPLDAALEGRDLDVVGIVASMAQRQDVGWRFRFDIEQAQWPGEGAKPAVAVPGHVYLGWYAASARDAEEADAYAFKPPQPGERWRFRVRLKAPHGQINPGGFDYELWLWEQGIAATGYVRQARGDPAPERLAGTARHPVEWARQQVRDRLLARLQPAHGAQVAGVLAALVTGDQAAIERSDWDVFRATGVSHLMSISGVHVTMLGWLVAALGTRLWRRSALWGWTGPLHWPAPSVGRVLGLAVAAAYALFSGWGVPAQRTLWMLAVVTVLRLSARDWHWQRIWALAAWVVVTLDPWALLHPGFWLSFVAVGVLLATDRPLPAAMQEAVPSRTNPDMLRTLVAGSPALQVWLGWGMARVWGLLREQALITLALLPLSLLFFGQFSWVGLLANLLAIPWVTGVVTPLSLMGMLWPVSWDLAAWSLQPLLAGLSHMAAWRWASVSMAMPAWPVAAMALAGTVLLVLRLPGSWRVWGVPLILPALLWQPSRPATGAFELLAADVGQGNAVLVRTARHSLLYDAGPRYSPESDAGHRVLVPLLAQTGEKLDALMLSHRDSDHTGGAVAVLAMQPQAALWSSLEAWHPLLNLREHQRCMAGQSWVWDGVRFAVLHPQPQDYEEARKSNALSCVLRIESPGASALLAGDVEAAQEQALVARGLAPVDWLLVPHHGSKTSSTPEWLQALQPQWALVQAGYRNRFGHPAPAVLARYRDAGIRVLDSSHCGAALWRSAEPDALRCERQASQRYWHHVPEP